MPQEELNHAIAHYDGALNYIDFQIGKIVDYLDKNELREDTLIVVTSDHGESLGEHNVYFSHGEYVYDSELKVPLVFSKKLLPKNVYGQQVQSTDIMPTILDVLKIPVIDRIDGISLLKYRDDKNFRKLSYAEGGISYFREKSRHYIDGIKGKWRMARTNEWKLICIPHPEKNIFELYNIKNDPNESNNIIEEEKEKAEVLKKALFLWIGSEEKEDPDADLTEKSKKLLRSLGYMD
jgi:arylsulfatase A-like enzyme